MRSVAVVGSLLAAAASAQGWCIDPTFGDRSPLTILDVDGTDDVSWTAQGFDLEPDGGIVVGGQRAGGFYAAALTLDGVRRVSFGTNGVATAPLMGLSRGEFNAVAVRADGTIALGGEALEFTRMVIVLVRLTSAGELDGTFGTGGVLAPSWWPSPELVNGLAALPDGRLLIGGQGRTQGADYNVFVAAVLPNGGLDPSYGTNGRTDVDFAGGDEFGGAIVLDDQQGVLVPLTTYVGGQFDFGLARLSPSGAIKPVDGGASEPIFTPGPTGVMSSRCSPTGGCCARDS